MPTWVVAGGASSPMFNTIVPLLVPVSRALISATVPRNWKYPGAGVPNAVTPLSPRS